MIDIRWTVKIVGDRFEKVLQYRKKTKVVYHFSQTTPTEEVSTYDWGEWEDVPTYKTSLNVMESIK